MTRGGLRAAALGALLASGCATRSTIAVAPPAAAARAQSRAAMVTALADGVLAGAAFDRATTALVVRSLATGETLYDRHGRSWLVPASTMKVLTTVAAAERLGWDFRFETRLVALGPVVDGTLQGDLLVAGTGDPTINPRHPERLRALTEWARALAAHGVRRIAGRVVGDDSAMPPAWGIGWAWDDLATGYGAAYGALQFNDNEVEVRMTPGPTPGAPPVVTLSPGSHDFQLDVRAVTAAEGSAAALVTARVPGSRVLEVHGRAPLGGTPLTDMVAVANPTAFFATSFRAALVAEGIAVDGAAVDIDDCPERPRASDGTVLHLDLSPPLREIVAPMLQWSRNSYAETLVTALDLEPPASTDDGLIELRASLRRLGVAAEGYHVRDGSGLSRNDYVSAAALADTLAGAWTHEDWRTPLLAVLPEAGRPGTLSRRLAGTAAAGHVRAKTGSMANVRSLAGFVTTTAGEPLVFAFICNGFTTRGSDIDAGVDQILETLVSLPTAR